MAEPERLEVDGSRSRPTWLVLLVAVVVLGGLLVIRLSSAQGPAPDTVGPPVSTSSTRSGPATTPPPPWPVGRGLPSGTLYVLAGSDVYSVDVASGLVEPLGLDRLEPDQAVLTAMAPGVLVWSGDGQPKRRLWYAGGPIEQTLGPLRSAASILPASGENVWTTAQQDRRPFKDAIWVLANDRGATGQRVRIRGLAVPDGAGGLLDVERTRLRLNGPGTDGKVVVGTYLIAAGPDGLMVDSCTGGLCTPELRDRASGQTSALGPPAPSSPSRAVAVFDPGALSPGNRFLAESGSNQDGGFELRITATAAPLTPVRTIPVGSRSTTLTWLSDRWLVATSAAGLLLYDAGNDTVLAPSLPFQQPTQLVFQPTA